MRKFKMPRCPYKCKYSRICTHKQNFKTPNNKKRYCGFKDHNNCDLYCEWFETKKAIEVANRPLKTLSQNEGEYEKELY